MTVKFGFYNSVGNDRVYDAIDVSSMFDGIITDGVFKLVGSKFALSQNSGMNIFVGSGKAWFNNTWTHNDANMSLAVPASDLVLPRIDTVYLEIDKSLVMRTNSIKIMTGVPNAVPVPPTLVGGAELFKYPLGYVNVGAGVTSIINADFTQLVGTVSCPFIVFPEPLPADTDAANIIKVQLFT